MTTSGRTLRALADLVSGRVEGDPDVVITNVSGLDEAGPGALAFLLSGAGEEKLARSGASAFVVPLTFSMEGRNLLKVKDPNLAVAKIHNELLEEAFAASGVHPLAVVGSGCQMAEEISIGPLAVIGDSVKIGKRTTVHAGVVLGDACVVGDDCTLYPNVVVYPGCVIGSRVRIHAGTVIGADGFGYATDEQGLHVKRPHVGIVMIEDDVEIGANTCIDRATFGQTVVGRGTKIDNLVMVGHNSVIGENCILVGQSALAGSSHLGRNVVIAGQSGVKGHIRVGDRVMVAARSGVTNTVDDGAVVAGMPAIAHKEWLRASVAFAKLPDLVREIRELRKKVLEMSGEKKP